MVANLARAHARAGKVADAEKALALVEEEAKKATGQPYYQKNGVAVARGLVKLAKGDAKAAAVDLAQCSKDNFWCAWERSVVLAQAGDAAGAEAARKLIVDKPLRDRAYAFVLGKVKK
jgi:ATP/maltotriose-dependent transcriptional regulator MalT